MFFLYSMKDKEAISPYKAQVMVLRDTDHHKAGKLITVETLIKKYPYWFAGDVSASEAYEHLVLEGQLERHDHSINSWFELHKDSRPRACKKELDDFIRGLTYEELKDRRKTIESSFQDICKKAIELRSQLLSPPHVTIVTGDGPLINDLILGFSWVDNNGSGTSLRAYYDFERFMISSDGFQGHNDLTKVIQHIELVASNIRKGVAKTSYDMTPKQLHQLYKKVCDCIEGETDYRVKMTEDIKQLSGIGGFEVKSSKFFNNELILHITDKGMNEININIDLLSMKTNSECSINFRTSKVSLHHLNMFMSALRKLVRETLEAPRK